MAKIRKNDSRIRDAAARAARVSSGTIVVEQQDDCVIVNLPNTMLLSEDEQERVKQEIRRRVPSGLRVVLV